MLRLIGWAVLAVVRAVRERRERAAARAREREQDERELFLG